MGIRLMILFLVIRRCGENEAACGALADRASTGYLCKGFARLNDWFAAIFEGKKAWNGWHLMFAIKKGRKRIFLP